MPVTHRMRNCSDTPSTPSAIRDRHSRAPRICTAPSLPGGLRRTQRRTEILPMSSEFTRSIGAWKIKRLHLALTAPNGLPRGAVVASFASRAASIRYAAARGFTCRRISPRNLPNGLLTQLPAEDQSMANYVDAKAVERRVMADTGRPCLYGVAAPCQHPRCLEAHFTTLHTEALARCSARETGEKHGS